MIMRGGLEMAENTFSRTLSFPSSFVFGVATSSVQIEGAISEGGRGEGIWDKFAGIPGKIADGSTPAVACDHYHKFEDDILEIKRLGLDAYRFSISWPRLFPESSHKINKEGVEYYNNLINCIVGAGLIPFVTLYHWDLPQYLQDDPKIRGWSTLNILEHFSLYAKACFESFGDRVRNWITFNEIRLNAVLSCNGVMAPGKSSAGPSSGSYIVAHNQLLAHAASVKLYRTNYQEKQKGIVGIAADVMWYQPMSDCQEDIDAVERCKEFEMGWILDPILLGDYSPAMTELAGTLLPRFTKEQSQDLKGSIDFIGLNYYFAVLATKAAETRPPGFLMWMKESGANFYWIDGCGKLLGEAVVPPEQAIFRSCPWGLRKVLAELQRRYGNIAIYILENGTIDGCSNGANLDDVLNDQHRIKFLQDHLAELSNSIRVDKVNVKGYFHWTLMDNWEWMNGFTIRFGLIHVDFSDPKLPRRPKASAYWLSSFLKQIK